MAEYFLVTGSKYNKNVRWVLGFLLLVVAFGLIVITGWQPKVLPTVKEEIGRPAVFELTTDIVNKSKFGMPYFVNVQRNDGSYSFARIENGVVMGEKFVGLAELTYQNGDSGLVKEIGGKVDIFLSKTGKKESASLIERAVTGIYLPDGSVYPVKIVNGKIVRGALSGVFEMVSLIDKIRILGKFDTRGNLVQVEVGPSIKEPNTTASLVGKELLKLSLEMSAGRSGSVLAATTDAPIEEPSVLNQSVAASFFQVQKDTTDGSLTVIPQTGPGVITAAVTVPVPLSGDVSIDPVTGLAVIGSGVVNGPKIAAGSISDTQLANDSVVESRIKDSAVTEGKIKDGSVTNNKLGTITSANKISGSAVQLSTGGGLVDSTGLSLLTTCASGEVLAWSGTAWICAAMSGGGSGVSSLNSLTGALTIAGGGINTVSALGTTVTVTGTLPSLDPTYFTTPNISQWTNNSGYIIDGNAGWDNSYGFITDGNSGWDNSYGFITASSAESLSNKTISGLSNSLTNIGNSSLTNSSVTINTNTPISGGGLLSLGGNLTLSLDATGSAGTYGGTTSIPVLTIDGYGRVTNVAPTSISGLSAGNLSAGDFTSVINSGTYSINISGNAATASSAFNATYLNGLNFSNPGAITNATGFNGLVITANTGVITTGTWNGSLVGLAYGGTNRNLTAVNGGIVWTDADSMEVSAAGTTGQVLTSNGVAAPSWTDISNINFWQRNSGALTPQQITNAINLGAVATSSAIVSLPGTTNNDAFFNLGTGKLGIGTNAPSWQLSQVGNNAGNIASIFNANTTDSTTMSGLRIAIGTASNTTSARFIQFYAGATTDSNGTGVGRIKLNNNAVQYQSGGADVAEYMTVASSESASAGDIISASTGGNVKATSSNSFLIGVVSDTAAFVGNATETAETDPNKQIVGIAGFVSTKVTGDIAIGDAITAGSTAGVGIKATKAGYIIGKAAAAHSGGGIDRILVSVLPGWYDPQALSTTTSSSFTISGNNEVLDSNGNVVSRIGAFEGLYARDATISSTLKLAADLFMDLTGSGITNNSNSLQINLTSSGTSGLTSSNSGMEVGAGGLTLLKGCADNEILKYTDASGWACGADATGGPPSFSIVTSGTNTTAAMVVGSGASLNFTGSGTINASTLGGATFAAPGTIGGGTAAAGTFTALTATGNVTLSGANVLGASPLVFDGSSPDVNKTTFAITDPTGARVITFPNASITVNAAGDISGTTLAANVTGSSLTSVGTLGALTVSGTTSINTAGAASTSIGNSTGTLALTGGATWSIATTGTAVGLTIAAGSNTISGLTNSNLSGTAGITDANLATVTAANKVSGSAVQLNANGGLTNSTGLSLLRSCGESEILKWTSAGGWTCASDTSGGTPALSGISAATGVNTINNNDYAQVWNWSLTSAGKTGFTFGENAASTNGVGSQYLMSIGTLADSTANPLKVVARGNTIINTTNTGGVTIGNAAAAQTVTIDAGTGSINLGNSANAKTITIGSTTTTGTTNISSGTGGILLAVGETGSSSQVRIGNSASATPDLLVLDNGTADPAGVNGGMYYSTNVNKFRCYQNGAWKDCDTVGSDLQHAASYATSETLTNITTAETQITTVSITPSTATGDVMIRGQVSIVSGNNTDHTLTITLEKGGTGCADATLLETNYISITSASGTELGSFELADVDVDPGTSALTYRLCAVTSNVDSDIRLQSLIATVIDTGADLAEVYTTNDESITAGDVVSHDSALATGVKKSAVPYDRTVFGVVATRPGLTIGGVTREGVEAVPVALSGRVPVRVSAENGDIKAGDYLTTSSKPGVAMKATKSGVIIGTAMTGYSGNEIGTVIVFVKNGEFGGSKLAYVMKGLDGTSSTYSSDVLSNLIMEKNQIATESADMSEMFTDRVVAGLEIITPRITTQNLLVSGDATFSGILYADTIKANRIEGVDILTKKLSLLTEQVAGVATAGAEIQSDTASEIDIFEVISNKIAEIFKNSVEFIGKVIFRGDVDFAGRPTFNKDTAGFATIKAGGSEVEILFEKEYKDEPVVTATVQIAGGANVSDIPGYAIADVDTRGFKIRMSRSIGMDIRFAWVALAVSETTKFEGNGESPETSATSPIPTPTIEVTSEPTPEVTVTPTPTMEISLIPEETPTPTVTPTVTISPEATMGGESIIPLQ